MEHQLKELQKRDALVVRAISEAVQQSVETLLPQVHLYQMENGNPVHLQAAITLAYMPDTVNVHCQTEICQAPPRAVAVVSLKPPKDEES